MSSDFNQEKDADEIMSSVTAKKSDSIIKILGNRTLRERLLIKDAYKTKHKKDIQKDVKSILKGDARDLASGLLDVPAEFDARELYLSMKGLGCNEKTLIEIIASRTNEELENIKKVFPDLDPVHKKLEDWIPSEVSGAFKDILLALLKCQRRINDYPDRTNCEEMGKRMGLKSKLEWEAEGSDIYETFIKSSPLEMGMIARYFHKYRKKTLPECILSDFSGYVRDVLYAILFATLSTSEYFADLLFKAMDKAGTDEDVIIRVIVARQNIDLELIKKYYFQTHKVKLIEALKDETSGEFQKLLIEIVKD